MCVQNKYSCMSIYFNFIWKNKLQILTSHILVLRDILPLGSNIHAVYVNRALSKYLSVRINDKNVMEAKIAALKTSLLP